MQNTNIFSTAELLELNSMNQSIVLAGDGSDTVSVLRANVIESFRVENRIEQGDVVISSGYILREDPALLLEKLRELSASGAAAFCIKPTYHNHIPDFFIKEAQELSLLLIQLPIECIFSNIVHEVATEVLQCQTDAFFSIQNQTNELITLLFDNPDMEEFLAKAEQILHTSLLIFDSLGNLLISKKTRDILPMFVQEELIHGLYTGSLNGHFQIACGKNVYYFQMEIMDIPNGGTFSLLLLQTEESEAGTDLLPIQRISNILALEIKNTSALNQIRRQNEYRFITEWLHGKMGSAFQICVSAESFGLRLSENADYRIVIVDVCEKDAEDLFIPRELHIVRHILQQFSQIATFLIQDGSLFLILNVPETDDEEELHRMLLDLGGKLQHILGRGPFNFCISQPCKVQDMPFAYEIALNISHISRACGIEGPFITSDQLYELSILSLLPRNAVVKDFVDRLLGPLERYDQRHTSNLLDTLSVYLSCGNNTKMTAEQLHVHYNSVVYRLDRIRSLLHVDLSDSEVCFQLRLALKIRIVQASN